VPYRMTLSVRGSSPPSLGPDVSASPCAVIITRTRGGRDPSRARPRRADPSPSPPAGGAGAPCRCTPALPNLRIVPARARIRQGQGVIRLPRTQRCVPLGALTVHVADQPYRTILELPVRCSRPPTPGPRRRCDTVPLCHGLHARREYVTKGHSCQVAHPTARAHRPTRSWHRGTWSPRRPTPDHSAPAATAGL
jgi:hypothetical protein